MIIKHTPEDFVVEETTEAKPSGDGPYCWFTLQKRNENTIFALQKIGRAIGAPLKAFGHSGNKDKQAVTTQTCSVKGKNIARLELGTITATGIGQSDAPVSLGSHTGNRFTITIRDLTTRPAVPTRFLNLFGEQRFSTSNSAIGKAIVQGIWDGMNSLRQWIWERVREFIDSVRRAMEGALGIGSPSRVTMEMGKSMAQGLVMGMQSGIRQGGVSRHITQPLELQIGGRSFGRAILEVVDDSLRLREPGLGLT